MMKQIMLNKLGMWFPNYAVVNACVSHLGEVLEKGPLVNNNASQSLKK